MHILIAEDDFMHNKLLTKFFEGLGHEVGSASDGLELVKMAMEKKPDLIVTDLHMPNMRGDTMIAMLENYPDLAGIPIIVVTGVTGQEVNEMGLAPNIPLFYKPVDFAKFSQELERIKKDRGL